MISSPSPMMAASRKGATPAGLVSMQAPPGDHERVPPVALRGPERDVGALQRLHHVEVVVLVGEREGDHREVLEWALRLHRDDRGRALRGALAALGRVHERALADEVGVGVEQRVDRLQSEVGHADVVGVGVDEGDRDASAPVLLHVAAFAAQALAGDDAWIRHVKSLAHAASWRTGG